MRRRLLETALWLTLTLTLTPVPAPCQPPTVIATAYCLKGHTTSGPTTGEIHALGGCIALSRDLVRLLEARFGDVIEIEGVGRYIFGDLMPPKWRMRVDIYHPSLKDCRSFGVKRCKIRKVTP